MTTWVFAYGSLIWQPEFPVAERRLAVASGWRRAFCLSSLVHRGTPARPGLVLALDADPTARCAGLAFRIAPGTETESLANLRARELVTSAYQETEITVATDQGPLTALTYVIDPAHPQYRGGLSLPEQAAIIAEAVGGRGPNRDYLFQTAAHLRDLGIADPDLDWLAAHLQNPLCSPPAQP